MFYENSEGKAAKLNGCISLKLHWSGGFKWRISIRALTESKRLMVQRKCRRALLESLGRWARCTGTMRHPDSASAASIPAWKRGFTKALHARQRWVAPRATKADSRAVEWPDWQAPEVSSRNTHRPPQTLTAVRARRERTDMRIEHTIPSDLLGQKPVRVLVVGAGGTAAPSSVPALS